MYKTMLTFLAIIFTSYSFGQVESIDFQKIQACRLIIDIKYKDREKDYLEAQKLKDVEVILIKANKEGKVKSFERGFVSTLVKGDYKGTFFESAESKKADQKKAQFPLFNDTNIYCYDAKCFDEAMLK